MKDHFFWDKIIVITGLFKKHTHQEMESLFYSFGAGVRVSVTRDTDYLICGVSPDFTAVEMASAYGVPILYEDDLIVWM